MNPYYQTLLTLFCMGISFVWGYHNGFKSACYQTGSFLLEVFRMKNAVFEENDIIFEDNFGIERKASEAIWED